MRRREFIAALGGAAAWPLVARGQTDQPRHVGMLIGYAEIMIRRRRCSWELSCAAFRI